MKPLSKSDGKQRDRFIETAQAIGADEDEATFKAKLAVIARQKPKDGQVAPPTSHRQKTK